MPRMCWSSVAERPLWRRKSAAVTVPADRQQEAQKEALLEAFGDGLVSCATCSAARVPWAPGCGYRCRWDRADRRSGRRSRGHFVRGAATVFDREKWCLRGTRTAPTARQGDADGEPQQDSARTQLEPVREDLGPPNRIGPDAWRLPTLSPSCLHPLELVLGLHLRLRNRAVLARRGERSEDVSRLQHRFAQAPVGRRKRLLHREFHALQKQSALDQETVVIRVGNALHPRPAGDLFSNINRAGEGSCVSSSLPCIGCPLCCARIPEEAPDAEAISAKGVFA